MSKILTLSVDGSRLVESSAAGLGCTGDWTCDFFFVGERRLDFEVNEVSRFGAILESRGIAPVPRQFKHQCTLTVPNLNVREAKLSVDGTAFVDLPLAHAKIDEPNLAMATTVLKAQYG